MHRLLTVLLLTSTVLVAAPAAGKVPEGTTTIEPTTEGERDPATTPTPPPQPVSPPVHGTGAAPVEHPVSADDVREAPRPGDETGRLDRIDPGDSAPRLAGRGLLWFVRLPLEIIAQPIRGLLYVKEKFNAIEVISNIFTSDDRKIAIFPTAFIETGFGLNVGARATFKDLLDHEEKLSLKAGFGGAWKTVLAASIDSGNLIAKTVSLGVDARYEKRDSERFYGYGNGDESDTRPPAPVDPVTNDYALRTRYQVEVERVSPHVRVELPNYFSVTATGAYIHKRADEDDLDLRIDETAVGMAYTVDTIDGFNHATNYIYTELETTYDSRRAGDIYDAPGLRTAGNLVSAFVGRYGALEAEDRDFYRGGLDLQHIFRIVGWRTLTLRAYGEHVTGDRADIPFTELTRIGGYSLLRGYDRDRFRDTTAIVGQANYNFPLGSVVAGVLFVDVGRVYSSLDDITYKNQRVGFGGALELYNRKSMVIRAELASSIDGGLFGYISLDPAFDAQSRVERR